MAKYRLSYLGYGGYKSIDLEKLECLAGRKVTDIQIIDEFTTSFENIEMLLEFLKRNKVIDEDVSKIVITVDKKENGETINKKIYRGESLLFKDDKKFLNTHFVYKWIMANINNPEVIIDICNNYIEKYKNAYNRITGSSYILSLFNSLKALAYNIKQKSGYYIRPSELNEYENAIKDFIHLEFYKVDKDVLIKTGKIERKCEEDGSCKKNYRNIHDFIVLLGSMGLNLGKGLESGYISNKRETLIIADNAQQVEEDNDEVEEFLTEADVKRTNKQFFEDFDKKTDSDDEDEYELRLDGNDFHHKMSREELEESLYETGMNLCLKPGDGDLK